jgi:hypothetical protein
MNNVVILLFYCKNTNLIKKLFICFVSKPRVGPINSQHKKFKSGNIFAGICTLGFSMLVSHFRLIKCLLLRFRSFHQTVFHSCWLLYDNPVTTCKHSNLSCWSIADEEKSFETLTHGVNVIKLFFFIADDEAK